MIYLILFVPILILLGFLIALTIKFWKTENPAKVARIFAIIAIVSGFIHIASEFYPYTYDGPSGLDYLGQAIVWLIFVKITIIITLVTYVSFAVVATIFAVKAIKAGEKKKGAISLILSWICGLLIVSFFLTGFISDKVHKKNITVEVKQIIETLSTEGEPAALIEFELHNGTKREIYYLGSIYDEVTQNGKQLYSTPINEMLGLPDTEIEKVQPGGTVIVKKAYKLASTDVPLRILCRTYGGDVTYIDQEFPLTYPG